LKPEILILEPIYAPAMAALERDYVVHKLWEAPEAQAFMRDVGARVRGLVTTGIVGFTRAHLEALPRLEIVACFGSPRGTFDMEAAKQRRLVVTTTPDVTAPSVADLALGLMLSLMRRIGESDRFVRAGKWRSYAPAVGRELGGKTCGIVGLGQIGAGIARRAVAFGMSVCYHGPRSKDVPYRYYADLHEMAKRSDCLVVACPSTRETRGLVDARILDALGPEGFLVNVARGEIVDERALIDALEHKRIAGAALDVYWREPEVPAALLEMDNVVLTPHTGSTTRELREERSRKLLANLSAHFAGEAVPYRFDEGEASRRQ
jgi:lactate dehydrogenase-like 2-hydroxyacid dehydrogenase